MNGVTKQLDDYFKELEQIGNFAIESIKEQIDIETDKVETLLQTNTPTKTGGLKKSLTRTAINTPSKYGYRLEYNGNDSNGVPYAKIANVLNYGSSKISPKRFVDKAVKQLKGLDERARKRWQEKLKGG